MPEDASHSRRLRGYLLALAAALCWASGGLTAKWLFTEPSAATVRWPVPPLGVQVEPAGLSAGRAVAAFVVLFVYLAARRRDELTVAPRDLPFLALFGVVGLAGVHFTYFKTISLTNVATAILLEYLAPVIVLLVGVLFMGQRLTWTLPAGVALSVSGCSLVVGAFGGQGLAVSPAGVAWGIASAAVFACYSLMGSVAVRRFAPYTALVYGLGFAALLWLVALGPSPVVRLFAAPESALALFFLAVVSTIVPFSAFLAALRHIPPTNATVTSTVEPVVAAFGAFVCFGESLTASQLLGGILVLAAIAVVQLPGSVSEVRLPPRD